MENGFRLRFPFKPLHWVTGLETEHSFVLAGLQCSLQADKPFLLVRVRPFSTEHEALDFIPRLWGALAWVAVELRTGFLAEVRTEPVRYVERPNEAARDVQLSTVDTENEPVDGYINGHMPSVIPLNKNIRAWMFGQPAVSVTWPSERYIASFSEALNHPSLAALYGDERLRIAIELLSDFQRENSLRSKFLTCMIALEVLAEPVLKHEVVQPLLADFDKKIVEQMSAYGTESEEYHALESLQRELVFRREASLRYRIRKLVLDGLPDLTKEDRLARSKQVVWSYDIRSALVHDGQVPAADLDHAREIAYQALLDLLARRIGLVHG